MRPVEPSASRIQRPKPPKPKAKPKPPAPKPKSVSPFAAKLRAMDRFESSRAATSTAKPKPAVTAKAKPREPAKGKGLIDKMADVNESVGRIGNLSKLPVDVSTAFTGRDVRGERFKFGNTNIPFVGGDKKTLAPRNTPFTRGATKTAGAVNLAQLPFALASGYKDIRAAIKGEGSVSKAIDSGASTLSIAFNGTKSIVDARDLTKQRKLVTDTVKTSLRASTPKVRDPIARADLTLQREGIAKKMANEALAPKNITSGRKLGDKVTDLANRFRKPKGQTDVRSMSRIVEKYVPGTRAGASNMVAKNAIKAAGPALKAGGRFAPGLNVAIAAADTTVAVNSIFNSKDSVGTKIANGVTALGSIAAATNIPVVSQLGAATATVSSLVKSGVAGKVGNGIKDGVKKLFSW